MEPSFKKHLHTFLKRPGRYKDISKTANIYGFMRTQSQITTLPTLVGSHEARQVRTLREVATYSTEFAKPNMLAYKLTDQMLKPAGAGQC